MWVCLAWEQVGGDGLFSEVLNGLIRVWVGGGPKAEAAANLRLGHIPAGSTDAVAYSLNGTRLPVPNGAPVRVRVERQLGYKHAKFVMRVEAVASLAGIGQGKGGYWEDSSDYAWYAGI